MARALSQVATDIRGSIGGITFTKNQWPGIVMRARRAPVNPRTTLQALIRSAMSGAAQMWKDASQLTRDGWNDYASTLIYDGPMGVKNVPGMQVFTGNLMVAIYLKALFGDIGNIVDTPPSIPGFLDIVNVQPNPFTEVGITGIGMSFETTSTENVVGYAKRSFAFNQTRNTNTSDFLADTMVNLAVLSPAVGIIEWTGLVEDLAYFINFRAITEDAPFRLSAEFFLRTIAETGAI